MVYDIDFKTGKIRWERELRSALPPIPRHVKNSYASETPVTDGERVYVYFGSIGLVAALDMNGKTVWTKELGAVQRPVRSSAPAASPVLHKDRLYIVNDNTTQSFIAAFDKRDRRRDLAGRARRDRQLVDAVRLGERAAHRDRDGRHPQGPLLRPRRQAAVGARGHVGNDVPTPFAEARAALHQLGLSGRQRRGRCTPSARARRATSRSSQARRATSTSPGTSRCSAPTTRRRSSTATIYYTLLDRGFLLCHDARTGKEIYGRQRISADASGFTASPWAYNGKIFVLSEDGDTFVIQAGPEFKVLGKNSLNEMSLATPAVVRGSVILRTQSSLYRIARTPHK